MRKGEWLNLTSNGEERSNWKAMWWLLMQGGPTLLILAILVAFAILGLMSLLS